MKIIPVVLMLGLWVPPNAAGAPGQDLQTEAVPDRSKILAVASRIMRDARYCGLVTIGEDGRPQARVVDAFAPEEDLTVWIATNPVTRKVAQIREDPRVTLFYFDAPSSGYVTVLGDAELIEDPQEKTRHWKPEWSPFYKNGSQGNDYLLIRVTPRRLEMVSYADGLLGDPETWAPVTLDFR